MDPLPANGVWQWILCIICLKTKINYFIDGVWKMNYGVSQLEERSCSVVRWYSAVYSCIACQTAAE